MRKNLIESHTVAPIEALTGKSWKVKIIEGDKQGSSAYYPKEVLEAQADIVKAGTKIYLDHPSLDEAENRPERSAKDIIGYFKTDSTYENANLYSEAEFFSDVQDWVKERAEAGVIGMSIRASGEVTESETGTPTLKKFDRVFSVDLVTDPGAGGGFEELLEAERTNEKEESMEFPKELAEALDAQANDVKSLTEAVTALVTKLTEAEKPEAPAEVDPLDVAQKLAESGLSKEAAARALSAHKAGTDLEEAIKNEKDYVEQIAESARQNVEFSANIEESGKSEFSAATAIFGIKK